MRRQGSMVQRIVSILVSQVVLLGGAAERSGKPRPPARRPKSCRKCRKLVWAASHGNSAFRLSVSRNGQPDRDRLLRAGRSGFETARLRVLPGREESVPRVGRHWVWRPASQSACEPNREVGAVRRVDGPGLMRRSRERWGTGTASGVATGWQQRLENGGRLLVGRVQDVGSLWTQAQ